MILVAGASNLIGYEICRQLHEQGKRVRAALRPGAPRDSIERLREIDTSLVFGHFGDAATVAHVCDGVEAVIATDAGMLPDHPGEMLDPQSARSLVEFAHVLGVRQFVYVTVPERFRTDCLLVDARNEFCRLLERRYANHTVLCANFFMETWLGPSMGFDYPNARATIYGEGKAPIAWASYREVAAVAVGQIGGDLNRGKCLNLDGAENISPLDVVRIFEDALQTRFEITHVPESTLKAEHKAARDPLARSLAALKLEYAHGCPAEVKSGAGQTRPSPRTTVRDYVANGISLKAARI